MKRIILILLLPVLMTCSEVNAQIISGFGVTAGVTYGTQKWHNDMPNTTEKYLLGYNGSAFAIFFQNKNVRWETEFEYNQKGAIEQVTDSVTNKYKNKINYISWNNYLKIRYELFAVVPYVLIGPRIEYKLSDQPQVYPEVINGFRKIHFSYAVGVGTELVCYGRLKPFIEAYYNPDLNDAYHQSGLSIKNKAFELKLGLRYAILNKKNSCPGVDSNGT